MTRFTRRLAARFDVCSVPGSLSGRGGVRHRPSASNWLSLLAAMLLVGGPGLAGPVWGEDEKASEPKPEQPAPAAQQPSEATPEPGKPQVPQLGRASGWVTSLCFTADGQRLATTGGQSLQYRPGEVLVWDVATGLQIQRLEGHESNVWTASFAPDGKQLLTGGYDGTVMLWDLAAGKSLGTLKHHKGWCRSVAFAPDGQHFATAGPDGSVAIWQRDKLDAPVRTLQAHEGAVFQLAFSVDGKTLGTAGTDKLAKLWDWQTGQESAKLEHEAAVWSIAFGEAGIATGGADRKVRLWAADGQPSGVLEGSKNWVTSVDFSADGSSVAAASYDGFVHVWDVASKQLIASSPALGSSAWAVQFAPQGGRVLVGTHEGPVKGFELRAQVEFSDVFPAVKGADDSGSQGAAKEAKSEQGDPPAGLPIQQHQRWVTAARFSPDGGLLASVGGESLQYRPGDVMVWDAASGQKVAELQGHETNVWDVVFSPDGKRLLTSGYDGTVILWDLDTKQPSVTLKQHKGWCRSVAFTPDGAHFATAGADGEVLIWDTAKPADPKSVKAHDAAVYDLAFSPDGKLLGTASTDKTAKLWDWQAGKETAKLEGHEDAVWSIRFGPDFIVTGGADRTIRLWSPAGEPRATLTGSRDWVTDLAVSPDGQWLAQASYGRAVNVWNVGAQMLQGSHALKSSAWTVDFAPDGKRLAVGTHKQGLLLTQISASRVLVSFAFPEPTQQAEDPSAGDAAKEEGKPEGTKQEGKQDEEKKDEKKD